MLVVRWAATKLSRSEVSFLRSGSAVVILTMGWYARGVFSLTPDEARSMSTNTTFSRLVNSVLSSHCALVLAGAVVLFVGASCSNATIDAPPKSSGGNGGNGGNGGGGGSGGGNTGCGQLCTNPGSTPISTEPINTKNCGNGVLDTGEQCDDGNRTNGDGCNANCQLEANYLCPTPGQPCVDQRKCGNGILTSDEACDDGNTVSGDGCSGDCKTVEPGYQCRMPGKPCVPLCGDGVITGSETCDDGNTVSGDGCSSTCQLEPGSSCPTPGQPS